MTAEPADVNPEFAVTPLTPAVAPVRLGGVVTLRDVALAAGVSISTASRVLDERLPPSRTAAADRVRKAAIDLGYVRDPLASGLRRSGTSTIGVVVPRLTDTVMAMLYEEIAAAAAARGLFAVVATTGDRPEAERTAVQSLLHRRVDGVIRTTARTGSPLRIDGDARQVLALRSDDIHPASIGDDHLGGYLATRTLIDHGHTRIGLVMGPEYATTAVHRRAGYREALTEAGIPLDDTLIAGDAYTMDAGETAAHVLLGRPDPPTAIFAVNDNNAIGVLAAAAARGLRIPDDLSVIGYNDIPVASKLPVPLTTIREPFNLIARGAIDLLLDETPNRTGDVPTLVANPTLIPRKSTAPPRDR
jgi:LacI family transcriptional regulator